MSKRKIFIDNKLCVRCGMCVNMRPEIFKFNGEKVEVVNEKYEKQRDYNNIDDVIEKCPAGAIKLE